MNWRNPANGCDALYLVSHAALVEGMDVNECKLLHARLVELAAQELDTYFHRWR